MKSSPVFHRIRPLMLFTVFLALLAALPLAAQSGADNAAISTDHQVLIGPGDLLSISAYDAPELAQQLRVEADGSSRLLLIGQAKLAGLTAGQAGKWIEDELVRRNYLVNPHVTVLISEFTSQTVSITGEVNHPGVYPIMATRSVLDVVSQAGGFTSLADTQVTVKHRLGSEEKVTVKLKSDEAEAALAGNTAVYPGDLIVVPRAAIVYVLGDVGRPGGFYMQDNGHITLLQAIAQAGGANYTAAVNGAYLLHKDVNGYVSTRVKVGELLKGHLNDFDLARNDILYVPSSRIKRLGEQTSGIVQAAAGAMVYHAIP